MSKKISIRSCSIFIIGVILGAIIFATYNYFNQSSQSDNYENQEGKLVEFQISPHNHMLGNYDAPVDLVVFNDFTCPYCQDYALILEKLMADYGQQVRLVWKHFPLSQQNLSPAISSECADEQGKFWPYARMLYAHQGDYDNEFYLDLADKLNLNQPQFEDCLTSSKYKAKVQADYYEGIMKGVIGAPSSFINGEYAAGAIPYERLVEMIEELI